MGDLKKILIYVWGVIVIACIVNPVYAEEDQALSEEQKMEEIRGYFESEYQEEDYFRTDRLLLTATRRNTLVRKAPAIATVITRDEIRFMGARDLRDVLTMVPGFGVSRNEFGIFMYEVRGIRTPTTEKILVMIDGHSVNKSIITGSALYRIFGDMPVKNIKQIEIIRGPGSALYGANAFVAVINIITRDAVDISGIELSGAGGSFDTGNYNMVGGKIFENGFKVSGSVDYFKTNGEDFYIASDALIAQGLPAFSTAPGYAFVEAEKTDVFLKASYKDLAFEGHYLSSRMDGFYIGFNHVLTDDSTDPITNYWSELSYSPKLTDRLHATLKTYIDFYEQDTSAEIFPEGYFGAPFGVIGGPKVKNQTIGGELQLDYDLHTSNHLIMGAMYERTRQYDVKSISNFINPFGPPRDESAVLNWNIEENRNVWALYVQDEWEIWDTLNLILGVRNDHYSDFGNTINPRAGLVWGFLENADIKLLYGQAFRAPNFNELYNINNPVVIGNPNLAPEKIKTYEAGTTVRLKNFFTIDLNYFHNDIEDLITWVPPFPARYVNAGSAEVDGVEVIVSGNYSNDNYWKLTYTYQDPEDGDTGAGLPDVPRHRAAAAINYRLTRYLAVHTDILWTGERSRQAGDTRPDTAQYTVVNLALTADNLFKHVEIQFTVHNVLDENYTDPDTSGANQFIAYDFPREGRNFFGEIRFTF